MREWKSAKKENKPEYPEEPAPPKRVIISDITIEAVGQRLKENPLGLLLYNDELDSFFGNMGRYNSGNDVPHWLSIHNGSTLTIDRKGGDYIRIAYPSVAIIGGVQPYILKERLKENPEYLHSGFIARFLLAMPPVAPIFLNHNVIPQSALSGWEWFLKSILQQRESAISEDGKQTPHVFPIEKAAWEILTEYQHRHAILAVGGNDSESAVEGKFGTNTARIALILHVVKMLEAGEPLSYHTPVSGETMESACILAEWFTDESKRIYAELAGGTTERTLTPEQREVMAVLERTGTAMTTREIKRGSRPCQRLDDENRLDPTLSELVRMGKIRDKFRTGDGMKDSAIEYEISTVDTVDADEPPKNTDVYGGYGSVSTVNTPENNFSTLSEFDEFAPAESSESPSPPVAGTEKTEGELVDLADVIRETFRRPPPLNVVPFSEILSYFDGDRVPASAFIDEYGFAVDDDGQVVNVA
jgi:hypothetical protein